MTGAGFSNGTFCQVTASLVACKNTGLDHCSVPTGRVECGGQINCQDAIARTQRAFLLDIDTAAYRCYDEAIAQCPPMSEEQSKKQEVNKEPANAERLKEKLSEDELKGVSGGRGVTEQSVNNWIDERIHFLDPSA